ncbi:MAG: leucyl aminopeptidase [Microthrixaceae bacterium]|nr:leucyl aminopeptidase [Microthrixaceae bacterium]
MSITFRTAPDAPADADLLAVLVAGDAADRATAAHPALDHAVLARLGFEGKAGAVEVLGGEGGRLVAAVGVGSADGVDEPALRRAGGALARAAARQAVVAVDLGDAAAVDARGGAQALAEGIALGAYSFDRYKSDPEPSRITDVVVVAGDDRADAVAEGLTRAGRLADAVRWARDLGNAPGGSLTPEELAEAAVAMAGREGLVVEVLDRDAIVAARLGGLLGVNRGSTQPPRFIELRHVPDGPSRGRVALVGKGVTFDSGGLSIKPADSMVGMQGDMGGAAAVLGAMSVVRTFAPDLEVRAYVPATDNMLGGDATRPGDVLTIRNGTTVEVLNTDAEGRLILADALSLAGEAEPDAVVDLATLTGACMVALGSKIAGLMANDDGWAGQVRDAAERAGERVWRLPLPDDYRALLDSPVADLKNVGPRWGGALTAGLFLREFVPDGVPWAHLDIAGPAWADDADDLTRKGATGFGVRTLVALLEGFEAPAGALGP